MDFTRRRVVVMLGAVEALSGNVRAQEQKSPPQTAVDAKAASEALRTALNGLVLYEVARRGGHLAESAVKEVDAFIGVGVAQLEKRSEIANPYSASMAIDGARRVGSQIVTEAVRVGAALKQIEAKIVRSAVEKLCPMFPFC